MSVPVQHQRFQLVPHRFYSLFCSSSSLGLSFLPDASPPASGSCTGHRTTASHCSVYFLNCIRSSPYKKCLLISSSVKHWLLQWCFYNLCDNIKKWLWSNIKLKASICKIHVNLNFNSLNVNGSKIHKNVNGDFIWISGTMCEFLSSLCLSVFLLVKKWTCINFII